MNWWFPAVLRQSAVVTCRSWAWRAPGPFPLSLTRSSSSNATASKKPRLCPIQSLDPSHLLPSDFRDLSSLRRPYFRTVVDRREQTKYVGILRYFTVEKRKLQFPDKTRGFFYYHSPLRDAISGEVRFRVTESNDPSTFASGADLLVPDGLPWRIPLLAILQTPKFRPQKELLVHNKLVTEDAVQHYTNVYRAARSEMMLSNASKFVYSLGEPFAVNFTATAITLSGVAGCSFQKVLLRNLFRHRYRDMPYFSPYSGSALCCFEKSTLPIHRGTRIIVMRIIKIVSPVQYRVPGYDGWIPWPTEGDLVMNKVCGKGTLVKPWSIDVDKTKYTVLRDLFLHG